MTSAPPAGRTARRRVPAPTRRPRPGAVYPNCPNALFQYHHQPFNYYANYAPGTPARAQHLRDEAEFMAAAQSGTLKPVSFVKPVGAENEHPGYASEHDGSDHLVNLIKAIQSGPQAAHTLIVVTYDEFGGAWDHVAPPSGCRRHLRPVGPRHAYPGARDLTRAQAPVHRR